MHLARRFRCGPTLAFACLLVDAAPAPAGEPIRTPDGTSIHKVDFERHVMGLLGRLGCNNGSCHGSFQGKGGLRLSLFGYDPEKDFLALTREAHGRRIDRTDAERSLVLLKPTGQVEHGGKVRFGKASWAYRVLHAWLADGAAWTQGSGEVKSLRVTPAELAFHRPGQSGRLRVHATFADGSTEEVTALCDFRTSDDGVAEVGGLGAVKAVRAGDAAVIVSYRGNVVGVCVLVPNLAPPDFRYPDVRPFNYVDREVLAKLRRLNMVPSDLCTDAEFLRRVTLDTVGILPTPDEVRAFLADRRFDKRARKIEELLAHPMHAALWATRFSDITGNNTDALEFPPQRRFRLSQAWHDWFRKRIAANMSYDEIVRGVLCATSREGRTPEGYIEEVAAFEEACDNRKPCSYPDRTSLDLFWRRQARVPTSEWGEKTAAAFLGVRLECAQCHKHPFDRWTQADYRSYANIFAAVGFGASGDSANLFRQENLQRNQKNKERQALLRARKKGVKVPPLLGPVREVFVIPRPGGLLSHPDGRRVILKPKALGGPEIRVQPGEDPRVALFEWMRDPENPFFARSFVNRVWGHYFGVGIVHPVDDFSLANPPSNPALLDTLAREFVRGDYDLRALERTILNSRTYQLSSVPNATNRFDRSNFARSYVRPLMAEVVVDVLNAALGVEERWGPEHPVGARAIEIGSSRVQNGAVAYAFRVFGRPPRTTACDCERAVDPGLPQKLYLMADPVLLGKLRGSRRVAVLLAQKKSDNEILEELFLATLSRPPTAAERKRFAAHREEEIELPAGKGKARKGIAPRQAVFDDALWALLNTTEFIFNH
jgi:hypothetical protein